MGLWIEKRILSSTIWSAGKGSVGLCGYRGYFGEDGMRLERGWGVILEKGRVWVGWVLGFAGVDGGEDWGVR